jgi:hypothetical protein
MAKASQRQGSLDRWVWELGVNFGHIQSKTLAVLNPFRRIEPHVMDDSDVAGPILFFFIFGTSLLVRWMVLFFEDMITDAP